MLVGVAALVATGVPEECGGATAGNLSGTWAAAIYGIATLGLLGLWVVYFDDLLGPTAVRCRRILVGGGFVALGLAAIGLKLATRGYC